jgi:hypothetical protein
MEIEQLMQTFLEEKNNRGIDFARERLHQKYSFLNWDKNHLLDTLNEWHKYTAASAEKEKLGYCVILGIAVIAISINLAVVLNPHFSDNTRRLYCIVVASGVALFARFVIYLRSVAVRIRDEATTAASLRREISELQAK